MTLTFELMAQMSRMMLAEGANIPPKVFVDMEGEFVDYQQGQMLTVRFPVKAVTKTRWVTCRVA